MVQVVDTYGFFKSYVVENLFGKTFIFATDSALLDKKNIITIAIIPIYSSFVFLY